MPQEIDIEGVTVDALRAMPPEDVDALLAFGRPITFRMGTATILAEFNRDGDVLAVNLAHIDGGGEGVVLVLWKLIRHYAAERGFARIRWNIHAATCAKPNPRLQRFLRAQGFEEIDDPHHGPIFVTARAP
jgi:hypothetical protein